MQVGTRRVLTLERVLQRNRRAENGFSESVPETRMSSGRGWTPSALCMELRWTRVSPEFTVVFVAVFVTQRQNQVVTTEPIAPQSQNLYYQTLYR